MLTISVNYTCKYRLKTSTNYVWTICGKCYNLKTGRLLKQIVKGGSIGYVINGNFKTLFNLKKELELIPKKENLPF